MNQLKLIKLFLRLALSASYLSAVADRFGLWPQKVSVWGNWQKFADYTGTLMPILPKNLVPAAAMGATAMEIIIPLALILGFKTKLFATLSGVLLLIFAFSMILALGIKAPLDYSVFTGAAASFALAAIREKFLEVDGINSKSKY